MLLLLVERVQGTRPLAAHAVAAIERGPSDYTWIGDMATGGQAILVVQNGDVTGHIQSGLKFYEITPIGGRFVFRSETEIL